MSDDTFDLDAFLSNENKDKPKKQKQQQDKGARQLKGVAQTVKMRDTFRIPFVYRVKKRVLNAMLVLPVFCIYMMLAHHYSWDMGTKTYLAALTSFMFFGGSYFFVSMIDPEDWQAVEKEQRSKKAHEL